LSASRGPAGESWRAWAALAVGVLAVSAHSASSVNLSVLMKSMLHELDWSRSGYAFASTLRLIALMIAMPAVGLATDRFGARRVLGTGAVVVGACLVGIALMRSFVEFAVVSVAMGPAQACVGSVAASALVLRLFQRHRGLAIGILNGGDNVINAGVPYASVRLLESVGWRAAVAGMAGVYLLLGLLIRVVLVGTDGRAAEEPDARAARHPLPWDDPRWWVIALAYAAIYAWVTSLQLHFHAYQTDLGRSPALAAELLSTQILVGAVGAPLAGMLAERTSARFTLLLMTIGLTVAAGALWNIEASGRCAPGRSATGS
jgi:sugar phosphate permease